MYAMPNEKLLEEAVLEDKWDIGCPEFPNKIFSYKKKEFKNIGYIEDAEHVSKFLYNPSFLSFYSPENKPKRCYVAVKKLKLPMDERLAKNILYEIKSLMMLEEKKIKEQREINIIRLYGYKKENRCYLLYMEWMDFSLKDLYDKGIKLILYERTLNDELKKKLNTLIGYITVEIIDALCDLCSCEKPIIHRDVKPENILLSYKGQVKLADFGGDRFENTKDLGGTSRYRPPEAFMMDGIDEDELQKYNVFSLGVVVFEYFCGMHPYDYINRFGYLGRVVEAKLAKEGELIKWSEEDSIFTKDKIIDDNNFQIFLSLSLKPIETRATPLELQETHFYSVYKKENGDPRTGIAAILNEFEIHPEPRIIASQVNLVKKVRKSLPSKQENKVRKTQSFIISLALTELDKKWEIKCPEFPKKIFSYKQYEFKKIGYLKEAEHISKFLYKPSFLSFYSPKDKPEKCYIAVKKLKPPIGEFQAINILNEIKSLMMLEEKKIKEQREINIIRLFGYKMKNGCYLLYMEWMDFSLKDLYNKSIMLLLFKRNLTNENKKKLNTLIGYITVEIIDALCDLVSCETPIIHRKLKPKNILLSYTGKVKLADFGEACIGITKDIGGSPRYRPPEAFNMNDVDEDELQKYDIFSLGVVVLEYFCGMHPYDYIARNEHHLNDIAHAELGELTKWSEEDSAFTKDKIIDDDNFHNFLSLSLQPIETRATPFELQQTHFYSVYKIQHGDPRTGVAAILNEFEVHPNPSIM